MKFDKTIVSDEFIYNALYGIRHSFDSEDKSDTYCCDGVFGFGPNDKQLASRLKKAGPSHRKFLRQIPVSVDITTSLEIWKQLDTYKVGTVANSTSTMHTVTKYPFTLDMFDTETMSDAGKIILLNHIRDLNMLRDKYLASDKKDTATWYDIIGLLPESWNQTRMWTANYEVIKTICEQRKGHKMPQWKAFIAWAHTLPFADILIFDEDAA